jgi:uncharacterized membrane protein YtjA (UPF0391 family)
MDIDSRCWRVLFAGLQEQAGPRLGGIAMLYYSLVFFIVALIAGVLGFGGLAGSLAWVAKVLFLIFLVLLVISLLRGRRPRV